MLPLFYFCTIIISVVHLQTKHSGATLCKNVKFLEKFSVNGEKILNGFSNRFPRTAYSSS